MLRVIKSNILLPMCTRAGTLATGLLLGAGAQADHANAVGLGVAGALLIATDLGLAWLRKQAIIKKALLSVGIV